jgi:protein-tyrosine phosphatase
MPGAASVMIRAMPASHLTCEGCFNLRDLGGLPTARGRVVRRGAVVRGDAPDRLTAAGWEALYGHGVRTIVDLRNDDELLPDIAPRPAGIATVHLPLDGIEDEEFWARITTSPAFGTPLYYADHVARFPERSARVVAAIAHAKPGGVLFHCSRGRDRTGQIAMLLLALLGVPAEAICEDYALSAERLPPLYAARGEPDEGPELTAFLAERGTTAAGALRAVLEALDVEAALRAGGLTRADVSALRARLLTASPGPR